MTNRSGSLLPLTTPPDSPAMGGRDKGFTTETQRHRDGPVVNFSRLLHPLGGEEQLVGHVLLEDVVGQPIAQKIQYWRADHGLASLEVGL